MPIPDTGTRGSIVVQVELDPVGAAGVYTNVCGVTNAQFSVQNEVIEFKVGDCDDWSLAVQTVKNYGASNFSMTIDAQWTADTDVQMFTWANTQQRLNVRLLYPTATSGQISTLDGEALMEGYNVDGIGNTDGNPQTTQLSLQYSGTVTPTLAV